MRDTMSGSTPLLSLVSGQLRVVLAPRVGGSIARFDRIEAERWLPVLRSPEGPFVTVLDSASFPLVPFCNRIRDGRFAFRGREISIAPNMAGDPSPLHGQGWLGEWAVEAESSSSAELSFRHEPGDWLWAYEARQLFRLDPEGLTLILLCRNLSAEPMPCGLGQHPYFPCTLETRLDTQVETAWTIDDQVLPVEQVPAAGRYDLRGRLVCGQDLDNGFGGWGGRARITAPGISVALELSSPDAAFFQLYSPASGGLFVAEPVSHANAALNEPEESWAELGMKVLESGESMSLEMRIEVLPAQ